MWEGVLEWIAVNLLGQVSILIGLIALVGLILQGKKFEEVVLGTVKAIAGVLIMIIGIEAFIGGLIAFQTVVSSAFGIVSPTPTRTLADFTAAYAGMSVMALALGFFIHLLLTSILKIRLVYLTGHLMYWIALIVTAALVELYPGIASGTLILVTAIICALYWTFQPLYIHKILKIVTKTDTFGFGHTSSFAGFLAAKLGPYVGKPEHGSETVKIPDRISFLKDITVSTAVVVGIIMVISALFADQAVVANQAGDLNSIVWALLQGLRFAAGITVLLYGVRMFLAEIVPAFKGISTRIIPGARPALDCPVIFPYAPTAVIIGFLSATVIFLICMVIFGAIGWAAIVPPMIMLFFPGGAAGVFGNAFGGWKGAVLGGVINGLFLAFGQALTWPLLANTAPELATLADPDWYILIWVILGVGRIIKAITGG
ncbi:MAG: Ascorbate-specific PTS system EIIC component [candidate division WS2 bacterium]|nr:Ascorbate-specific PTS system EIIC component [Candidatus Psychracetigena formicireducens]